MIVTFLLCLHGLLQAQGVVGDNEPNGAGGSVKDANGKLSWGRDTSKVDKSIPTELFQWRIDPHLGEVLPELYNDTLPHLFQNQNATDGLRGEYTILGNLGSPRMHRNFLDRPVPGDLLFFQQYDMFHVTPENLLFTNTKSPFTNLQYHKCGTQQSGQDRFTAYFATNVNRVSAIGFKLDYLYGRGYYNNQSNSQFGGTLFGYHRGERYQMHAVASWDHLKMAENGGIESDKYITDPESYARSYASRDIPTNISSVWNRNDGQTYFLTHRYNLGFYREKELPDSLRPTVPSDDELLKRLGSDSIVALVKADSLRLPAVLDSLQVQWRSEQDVPMDFVPVTAFVHTFDMRVLRHFNYARDKGIPSSYFGHDPYYRSSYDDFKDFTQGISMKNTLGVQLREGFNKWAKAGVTLFATHELRQFKLPTTETNDSVDFFQTYKENHLSVGGELQKTEGKLLHYRAGAELWVLGPDVGDLNIYGTGDLNFRLWRDTVHLVAKASFQNIAQPFYYRHFHSQTTWWDNDDLSNSTRTHLEGELSYDRTHTRLRFGAVNISNYTYLTNVFTPVYAADKFTILSYSRNTEVRQQSGSVQVLSASLNQDFHLGIFHWDNQVTWQASSNQDVLPLPTLTVFTNPYIVFNIAKVLRVELGGDLRFNTKYYAPDYAPFVNQFVVQDTSRERVEIGNYPIINVYANFAIKRVRGYVNVTHVNAGSGNAFWAPHYPIDPMSIHLGLSWNFYN